MALRKKDSSENPFERAARNFHNDLSGLDVGRDFEKDVAYLELLGYEVVSPMHDINDRGYRPVSALEREMSKLNLGYNDSDGCFTVEKDGYEALVIEHAGQYLVSSWVYERGSGSLRCFDLASMGEEDVMVVHGVDFVGFREAFEKNNPGYYVDKAYPVPGSGLLYVNPLSDESEVGLGMEPCNPMLSDWEGNAVGHLSMLFDKGNDFRPEFLFSDYLLPDIRKFDLHFVPVVLNFPEELGPLPKEEKVRLLAEMGNFIPSSPAGRLVTVGLDQSNVDRIFAAVEDKGAFFCNYVKLHTADVLCVFGTPGSGRRTLKYHGHPGLDAVAKKGSDGHDRYFMKEFSSLPFNVKVSIIRDALDGDILTPDTLKKTFASISRKEREAKVRKAGKGPRL